MAKGKHKKQLGSKPRVHTSRTERSLSHGKTKNSKLRKEGKAARAFARNKRASVSYRARSR